MPDADRDAPSTHEGHTKPEGHDTPETSDVGGLSEEDNLDEQEEESFPASDPHSDWSGRS